MNDTGTLALALPEDAHQTNVLTADLVSDLRSLADRYAGLASVLNDRADLLSGFGINRENPTLPAYTHPSAVEGIVTLLSQIDSGTESISRLRLMIAQKSGVLAYRMAEVWAEKFDTEESTNKN